MVTHALATYIAGAGARTFPSEVAEKGKQHLLDTIAAMVSGSRLSAGRKAIAFIASQGGVAQSSLIGSPIRTTAVNAAHALGMMAHADETDDSHAPSLTHPGCAVVPAALATAEQHKRNGRALLAAVIAGYDIGTRISLSLGAGGFFDRHHSSHAFGGVFGATAAAASAATLGVDTTCHALAYAVQMASGNTCWRRDPNHVEKAFIFGGMPARNGVLAVTMAGAGFVGSSQAFEGTPGLFAAYPDLARPELATDSLGDRFEVMRTTIKKWCVGSPIQSALDSIAQLVAEHGFTAHNVDAISISLPRRRAAVVQNPTSPDLNIAHQLAVLLVDGSLTFASTHDHGRVHDSVIQEMRSRISVVAHDGDGAGQPMVTVLLRDGRQFERQTLHVRGSPGNPMSADEVIAKATDLMQPVLGMEQSTRVCHLVLNIEEQQDLSELISILRC